MNKKSIMTLLLSSCLIGPVAFADDDCTDPVADWQPKENLQQMMESKGWKVNRIKVDDGCYEVKGIDRSGNKVEAKFAPASLRLKELEIDFSEDADTSEYLNN